MEKVKIPSCNSKKIDKIEPTVFKTPKYYRPQSPFATFVLPRECQPYEEDEKLLYLVMHLKRIRKKLNNACEKVEKIKNSLSQD
ncbi:hypothetical protein PVAND_008948 [Polypedilum vanderplanki]|uniref:Uncharacterized protein n=1 Tax=Polypedilum vanderplanki TaxID=319348 RepID=A0A9J6CCA7_POLVA|nr:hypothetical protein PVAND_008948 [Polypedilum vanderplanki]